VSLTGRETPITALLSLFEMFHVDMIKPLIQSGRAMTAEWDGTVAEATPEL
jgi:hypothetical protein